MKLTSSQVRDLWSKFWSDRGHHHLVPASIIADSENQTVLFNVAGMQQLVPYLIGKPHPHGPRLYNIQKCLRTNDIDDIGDERHLSLFEMMGNWSLGDYFKPDALKRSVEFLVDILHIDPTMLGATVFAGSAMVPRDVESIEILRSLGIQHIQEIGLDKEGESDNFWTPGPVGPCGPCCELYIDRGEQYGPDDRAMGTNDRYTEIWNNVFMSYYADGSGTITPLTQTNVDTGMWFERLMMILQQTPTIFETDIFEDCISQIALSTHTTYPPLVGSGLSSTTQSYRIVTDHSRSATVLVSEWVVPSNEWRGYVLRRLIRRMRYHITTLCPTVDTDVILCALIHSHLQHFAMMMGSASAELIVTHFQKEVTLFQHTIAKWSKLLHEEIQKIWPGWLLSGSLIFHLYDTHGFPVELTQEIARQSYVTCDMEWYHVALSQAKTLSRATQQFKNTTDRSQYLADIPPTQFHYDVMDMTESRIIKDFTVDGQRIIILDHTSFYAESGGQKGDTGRITTDTGEQLIVTDVKKFAGVFLHLVKEV